MPRVKRGTQIRKKRKKLFSQTKGYKHGRKNVFRHAKQALLKAKTYEYRDRRTKKRDFRRLWIVRINAACRANNIKYSEFIKKLSDKKIELDRKILADLAINEPEEFKKIVEKALDSDKVVIGVLTRAKDSFVDKIKMRQDVEIIEVDRTNREELVNLWKKF